MAVHRESPKCPSCGGGIGEKHKDQSKIPFHQRVIGDTFLGWDWEGHKCEKKPIPYIYVGAGRNNELIYFRVTEQLHHKLVDGLFERDWAIFRIKPSQWKTQNQDNHPDRQLDVFCYDITTEENIHNFLIIHDIDGN